MYLSVATGTNNFTLSDLVPNSLLTDSISDHAGNISLFVIIVVMEVQTA